MSLITFAILIAVAACYSPRMSPTIGECVPYSNNCHLCLEIKINCTFNLTDLNFMSEHSCLPYYLTIPAREHAIRYIKNPKDCPTILPTKPTLFPHTTPTKPTVLSPTTPTKPTVLPPTTPTKPTLLPPTTPPQLTPPEDDSKKVGVPFTTFIVVVLVALAFLAITALAIRLRRNRVHEYAI